jgi:DNA-binding PadR family transcriptional regulator
MRAALASRPTAAPPAAITTARKHKKMYRHLHPHGGTRQARGIFGHEVARFGNHHRGGRDRRSGRVFDHGDLRYVLLHLIAEKPRHGYELIKAIEEQFGGTYSPSPGVIYPTLTLLEELGYLRPETAEGPRKLYSITAEGTAFLAANRALVEAIFARMAEATRAIGDGPAPEIRRAMRNLDMALSIRLGRGPLEAGQVRTITEALDRVAGEIERG